MTIVDRSQDFIERGQELCDYPFMHILIPGGSGQVGTVLARHLTSAGHDITVLSRTPKPARRGRRWLRMASTKGLGSLRFTLPMP